MFKITEFVPGRKIVWHVLQNYFNFVKDTTEWTGTDVVFEIAKQGDQTAPRFTHVGLTPAEECYGLRLPRPLAHRHNLTVDFGSLRTTTSRRRPYDGPRKRRNLA